MIDDIDRIMSVMAQAFDPHWGEAWNRRQIGDALLLPATGYILADASGQWPAEGRDAAAFALTRQTLDEAELLLIAVVPQERGRGLGRIVLEQVIAAVRGRGAAKLFLEMRHNNPAEHLYRALGFVPVGRRPAYYRLADGSRLDAVTFALAL
ncbi:MAG: GNAT family N-acetyltransferase [Sphingomonadaceae bacterium]|nr:GNAT family N-acetyltransferase [Sphingomonadaceae bacterium]